MTLQDRVELTLEYVQSADKLFVHTVVATLPDNESECAAMCRRLLEMNCLEQETSGGTLALDGSRDTVLYQTGLTADGLTLARLDKALQELLAHRQRMIDSLKGAGPAGPVKRRSTLAYLAKFEGAS